jgi:hypothetical protein
MPASPYKNAAGKRVPRVTTITSRFADKGGIIHWAWQMGMDGKDFREERDAAANVGTQVHHMVEAHLLDRKPADMKVRPEDRGKVLDAYAAYLRWYDSVHFSPMITEEELISEKMQVGGRLDVVAEVSGRVGIVDWKTSGGVYPDMLVQQAAYGMMLDEVHGLKLDDVHILRFGKDDGSFHHHSWPWDSDPMQAARDFFFSSRDLYELDKRIKKAT